MRRGNSVDHVTSTFGGFGTRCAVAAAGGSATAQLAGAAASVPRGRLLSAGRACCPLTAPTGTATQWCIITPRAFKRLPVLVRLHGGALQEHDVMEQAQG